MFEEWGDFGIYVWPFGVGVGRTGRSVRYVQTDTSHVLRTRLGKWTPLSAWPASITRGSGQGKSKLALRAELLKRQEIQLRLDFKAELSLGK